MRIALVFLALLAASGSVWLLWSPEGSSPPGKSSLPDEGAPPPSDAVAQAIRQPSNVASSSRSSDDESESASAPGSSATGDSHPAPVVTNRGSIVLVDEQGNERTDADGWFQAEWICEGMDEGDDAGVGRTEVEVRRGSFEIEAPRLQCLLADDVFLDGRWAVPVSHWSYHEDGPVVLRCKWVPPVEVRLVVRDESGVEHDDASGSFQPRSTDLRDSAEPRVLVTEGGFEVDPARGSFTIQDLVLDGRAAVPDEDWFHHDENSRLVRCRWLPPTRLRVLDADSGRDLDRVRVVPGGGGFDETCVPCTVSRDVVLGEGPSPLQIDRPGRAGDLDRPRHVLVGAPGYAWKVLELDFAKGGTTCVDLEGGGDLEVRITGSLGSEESLLEPTDWGRRPVLRLRRPGPDLDELPSLEEVLADVANRPVQELEGGVRPSEEQVRLEYEEYRAFVGRLRGELIATDSPRLEETILLTGIAPGPYVVAVEVGKDWDGPEVLGEGSVELEAGENASITLHVRPPTPRPDPVPLAGTLSIPPRWASRWLTLDFEPLDLIGKTYADTVRIDFDEMDNVPGSARLYRWDAGLLSPGRYRVEVADLTEQLIVETGPHGRDDVEIVIANPASVEVEVRDERTGEPVSGLSIGWHRCWPPGVTSGSPNDARANGSGVVHFEAPAAAIELWIRDHRYLAVDDRGRTEPFRFELREGDNRFQLRVRPTCGLCLSLMDGSDVVPVHWEWLDQVTMEAQGFDGTQRGFSTEDDDGQIPVSAPGRYRVTLPDLEGFEPIPPFDVDVAEGTYVRSVIQLRRRT